MASVGIANSCAFPDRRFMVQNTATIEPPAWNRPLDTGRSAESLQSPTPARAMQLGSLVFLGAQRIRPPHLRYLATIKMHLWNLATIRMMN